MDAELELGSRNLIVKIHRIGYIFIDSIDSTHVKYLRIFSLVVLFSLLIVQGQGSTPTSAPLSFLLMEEGEDFPSVLPAGSKQDSKGNIHAWYYYIEPDIDGDDERFMILYYSVVTPEGKTYFYQLDKHPFDLTYYAVFSQQQFLEFPNGTVSNIFLKPSDFGTKLKLFSWDGELTTYSINYTNSLIVTGDIIGPVTTPSGSIEYYLPAVNLSGNYLITLELTGGGTSYTVGYMDFPSFTVGILPNITNTIFDVVYANGSRYFLAGVRKTQGEDDLVVIKDEGGNYTRWAYLDWINVKAGSSIAFLRKILVDAFAPKLVATDSGRLYTFLSNFNNDFNMLTQWKNGTAVDLFEGQDPNPFFLSFFPSIYSTGDTVRIFFLGIQYAQDTISFSIDRYTYVEKNSTLIKYRFIENALAADLFLYSADPFADQIVGIATRYSTPKPTLNEYGILNSTVGEVYLVTEFEIPEFTPSFVNLVLETDVTVEEETDPLIYLVPIIGVLLLALTYISYYQWRKRRLAIPSELDDLEKSKPELIHGRSRLQSSIQQWKISKIYLMTNKSRLIRSVVVLFVPALLLMSLFTGIASHQSNLMLTFEAQNPLNDADDLSLSNSLQSDFKWQNLWFSDEFQNNTLSELDMILPGQLSRNSMQNYGLQALGYRMSTTTIFPLFSKTEIHFEFNNETIDFNFPDPHEIAVISESWKEYLSTQLVRGRLPTAPNEVLLQESWFVPRNRFAPDAPYGVIWDVGSKVNLYASELDLFLNTTIPGMDQNLTVVGVVKKVENLPFSEITTWADRMNTTVSGMRILDSVPFYSFPGLMSKFLNNYSRISIRPTSYVYARYDVFNLEREEIPTLIDNLREMGNSTLQVTGFTWLGDFDAERISVFLQEYYDASRDIQLEGFVLTVPVVALALLLTFEALGMGKTSSLQEIIRFRREGLRTERIVALLAQERMLTAGIATLLSWIAVPVVTRQMMEFTDYFKMNAVFTPPVVLDQTPVIALITFLLLTLVGMLQSLQVLFSKEDWRYSNMMSGVQKDLVVVIVGLVLVVLSNFFAGFLDDQLSSSSAIDPSTELVLLSVQLISVVFATIGGLIVISKILNRIFALVGYIGWKSIKKKQGLIFKGFQMHVGLYGKLLVIFLISFFLIIPMLTIPLTIGNTYKIEAYYEFGTDINVEKWDTVEPSLKQKIMDLQEVKSTSEYFYGVLPFANGVQINVFAINTSTFMDTIYIPTRYVNAYNVSRFEVDSLQRGEILTNAKFMERNSLEVGERIPLQFEHTSRLYRIQLKGSYNEFPIFKTAIERLEEEFESPLQMVISMETLLDLQDMYLTDASEASTAVADYMDLRNLLIKATDYNVVTQLSEQIKGMSGTRVQSVTTVVNDLKHPFFRAFEFLTHTSIIVSALAPLISTVILSRILFERRKEELEVYYRTGTDISFFTFQLGVELVFSTLLPSLLAIPLGYWWSVNYGPDLFGQTSSSLSWDYNELIVSIWVAVVLLLSLLIWIQQIRSSAVRHLREVRL